MKFRLLPPWRLPLLVLLAAALAASVAVSEPGDSLPPVVESSREPGETVAAPYRKESAEILLPLIPRRLDNDPAEIFRVVSPPPLPKATATESETRPTAPPLPFKFLGRMVEGDRIAVLLSFKGKDVSVSTGDDIDSNYRVDEITADEIRFIYLPLREIQTLNIGEKN